MPHSIMPGSFLPRSPTLEPNNLPDLHTSMQLLLHDDSLPSTVMAPFDVPRSSKSTEDDKENIPSSGGSLWGEQTSYDCIDTVPPRPAAGESSKRNDTSAEHVGFFQEQESNERERLRDKEKIQYLEEEIRKLKKEVGVIQVKMG